jgi:hypothetical protein
MPLKYQNELLALNKQPCPCLIKHTPKQIKAYRFVNNVATEVNFLPIALTGGPNDQCSHWALSFFNSEPAARAKFRILNSRVDAKSRYGDHIGEIDLNANDGFSSQPSSTGHLDLYDNENISFLGRVVTYYPLP